MSIIKVNLIEGSKLTDNVEVPESLCLVDDDQQSNKDQGFFRILSIESGDDRVVWDRRDPEQIKDAAKLFNELIAKGQIAYAIGPDGKTDKNRQLTEFDATLEEIMFIPTKMLAGG